MKCLFVLNGWHSYPLCPQSHTHTLSRTTCFHRLFSRAPFFPPTTTTLLHYTFDRYTPAHQQLHTSPTSLIAVSYSILIRCAPPHFPTFGVSKRLPSPQFSSNSSYSHRRPSTSDVPTHFATRYLILPAPIATVPKSRVRLSSAVQLCVCLCMCLCKFAAPKSHIRQIDFPCDFFAGLYKCGVDLCVWVFGKWKPPTQTWWQLWVNRSIGLLDSRPPTSDSRTTPTGR